MHDFVLEEYCRSRVNDASTNTFELLLETLGCEASFYRLSFKKCELLSLPGVVNINEHGHP